MKKTCPPAGQETTKITTARYANIPTCFHLICPFVFSIGIDSIGVHPRIPPPYWVNESPTGNRLNRTYQCLHGPSGPMTCLLYWVNESFPLNTNSYKKIIRFYKFM